MKNAGYVYLISAVETKYFKIGISEESVVKRLKQLQTGCPFKLLCVYHAYVANMFQTEKELHKIFSASRRIGEWFSLTTEDVQECITLMRLMEIDKIQEQLLPMVVIEEVEEVLDVKEELLETVEDNIEDKLYTTLKLTKDAAISLILKLKSESRHTQTEIIWMLWNAKPGVTKAYKNAVKEFKELTNEG
jgi:hypothetical protein